MCHTEGKHSPADLLTKAFSRQHLERLRPLLGLTVTTSARDTNVENCARAGTIQ